MDRDGYFVSEDKLEESVNHTDKVAVLMDDNTVIAKHNDICFNLNKAPGPKQLINIGRTTTFFSALILQDLLINNKKAIKIGENNKNMSESNKESGILDTKENAKKDKIKEENKEKDSKITDSFGQQCENALNCAYNWSEKASIQWNNSNYYFNVDYGKALNSITGTKSCEEPSKKESVTVQSSDKSAKREGDKYLDVWKRWNSSSQNLGILRMKKEDESQDQELDVIQTWRGESTLESYICTGGPKRTKIDDLISNISRYISEKNPKHPYNTLFIADPGWGKSFLAKSLAKKFDLQFMEFSLSQMASTEDLIDSFDYICSYQNQNDKKVLIFMDEVNCEIEGSPVLGLLLNPIWDGNFVRNGKTYKLSPAVWIFASTGSIEDIKMLNKGDDFISRLNGPIIRLDNKEEKNLVPEYILTEQVYIGISMLNRYFGPISSIEESVLSFLHDLEPVYGMRSLEFFISKFRNIQRGKVLFSNMPTFNEFPELRRHIINENTNYRNDKLIKIITQIE